MSGKNSWSKKLTAINLRHFGKTDITPLIPCTLTLGRQTFLFCRNEHTLRRFGVCKAFKFNDTKEDK